MEKAILKTLIYADIFDYPLKINEIHRWLIEKKITLRQMEKALKRLSQQSKIKGYGGYYFLQKRNGLVAQRRRREKQSAVYFKKAKILSQILKVIPGIKLVGISGGLAMGNAGKSDDIDLFIITGKNRLWISRLLILGLLSVVGQRRKRQDEGSKIAGKICTNILLEEDQLEQKNKDIFTAHEVLQMKVLWQRGGVYEKYLMDNEWAFKFLPNWVCADVVNQGASGRQSRSLACQRKRPVANRLGYARSARLGLVAFGNRLPLFIESLAKSWQFKIMQQPQGMERIEEGALYFHPKDCRLEVLKEYKLHAGKLSKL